MVECWMLSVDGWRLSVECWWLNVDGWMLSVEWWWVMVDEGDGESLNFFKFTVDSKNFSFFIFHFSFLSLPLQPQTAKTGLNNEGRLAEWSIALDSKSGIPFSGIGGLNPSPSATEKATAEVAFSLFQPVVRCRYLPSKSLVVTTVIVSFHLVVVCCKDSDIIWNNKILCFFFPEKAMRETWKKV